MRQHDERGADRKFRLFSSFEHKRHHDDDASERGRRRGGRLLDYGELRLLILSLIAERPSYGYELIKAVEKRFAGSYTPSPGVLYPTLAWLEDIGYATVEANEGNRKTYRITPEGQAYLAANPVAVETLRGACDRGGRHGGRHGAPVAVVEAMDEIKAALRGRLRGAEASPETIEMIATVLREAARRIEMDCPSTEGCEDKAEE